MATSGSVNTNSYGDAYLRLEWTRTSYDISNNINYISWTLKGVKGSSGYYLARNFKVTSYSYVTGNTTNLYESSSSIQLYDDTVIASGTDYFYANSDGTCRIQFNIEGAIYQYAVNCTGYDAWDLDRIPRKSTLYASNGRIGVADVKFTIDRKYSGFTDSIYYVNPSTNAEVQIVNKTSATSYTWSPPTSLYQYFPNSERIYLTFKSYTYNGSTQIGSDTTHAYIYANETACQPTLSVTVTPTDYSSLTGSASTIIKGASNVSVSATAAAQNSATIKSIVTNGTTLSTNSTTGSKTFTNVDTNTFTTVTTDSRGYTKTDTQTFTLVDYIPLTVTATTYRVNATSDTVKAVINGNYFSGSFGSQSNTLTLTWKWKLSTDSSYTTGGTLTATASSGTYTTGEITLGTGFDYDKDYDFLFTAQDKILTKTAVPSVRKGIPIFDYGVDSNGDNYFNINGYLYGISATTDTEIPTNEYIDGNRIYRKRYNCGELPNNSSKNVNTDLTGANNRIVRIEGVAIHNNGTTLQLPYVTSDGIISVAWVSNGNAIQLYSTSDRSSFNAYVDLYYTKITS